MPNLSNYNFTLIRKDNFIELTYNTDKKIVLNLDDNLVYNKKNSTSFILSSNLISNITLNYTNSTNPTADNIDDYFHILRKLFAPIISKDFNTDLALGNIEGCEVYVKFGENLSIGTTQETLWCQGGDWSPLIGITGETMNIVSSSTDDVGVTGTGGRTLQIFGLTTNDISLTEVINLNGTSTVTTTNNFTFIHRAIVLYAGSNEVNIGDITLTASTSSTIQAKIPANGGITQQLFYKAPADHMLQVKSGTLGIINDSGLNPKVTFEMWFRYPTGIKMKTMSLFMDSAIETSKTIKNEVSHFLPEGGIIEVRVLSDTANTKVHGSIYMIIQDKYS